MFAFTHGELSCIYYLLYESMFFLVYLIFSIWYEGKSALELASIGTAVSIFNILLLSIATSFVVEDISKNGSKIDSCLVGQ